MALLLNRYTVTWKDTAYEHRHFSKLVAKALWKKLIAKESSRQKFEHQTLYLVYEGGSLLVSPTKFNWEEDTENFDFRTMLRARDEHNDNQPAEQVQAIIKFDKAIETTELNAFLNSITQDDPQEFPQVLVLFAFFSR